jgi:membrane-bound lytic murein transglycosylase B
MKRAIRIALGTGTIIAGAAALSIGAAFHAAPQEEIIGRTQYNAALAGIEAARPLVQARCERQSAAGREQCRAQAEADEMLRVAQIENGFRRDRESARGEQRARIEARYNVERAKCVALGGLQRDRCQITAHATRGRALLELAAPYEIRS